MDVRTASACAENQANAREWSEKARAWLDTSLTAAHAITQLACAEFAVRGQEAAARLYAADRRLRLGEGSAA